LWTDGRTYVRMYLLTDISDLSNVIRSTRPQIGSNFNPLRSVMV